MAAKKSILARIFCTVKLAVIWFFISTIGFTVLYRFVPVPLTPLMVIRLGEQLAHGQKLKLHKDWRPIDKISSNLPLAVIASEDQLFSEHWGFDVKAIEKAIKYNEKKKGKRIKGGSTISQQTAKNVFLWAGRSWLRKGLEVYFTLLIEGIWSKERIIEVYLNVIEMGDGIYGAEAASRNYFNRSAATLMPAQCAAIASVLPNPLKWSPVHPSPYLQFRQEWILRNMNNLGPQDL